MMITKYETIEKIVNESNQFNFDRFSGTNVERPGSASRIIALPNV